MRATAIAALARLEALTDDELGRGLSDAEPTVRMRACEVAAAHPGSSVLPLLTDTDPMVVEAAAWALGEWGEAASASVEALSSVATGHADALCREAAVAALGAIGDERGLPAILAGTGDKPAVRRRAIMALAPFEGPEVDAALARAHDDRDWQVRQAAEDLTRP